jgi:hypothetical protein
MCSYAATHPSSTDNQAHHLTLPIALISSPLLTCHMLPQSNIMVIVSAQNSENFILLTVAFDYPALFSP